MPYTNLTKVSIIINGREFPLMSVDVAVPDPEMTFFATRPGSMTPAITKPVVFTGTMPYEDWLRVCGSPEFVLKDNPDR